jgi:hypothetical protein
MSGTDAWLRVTLAVLATWRITHLLAHEDGPGDIIARLRLRLGHGFWGRLLDCFYCLSLWVAAASATLARPPAADWPLWWLGCSGAACLLERLAPRPSVVDLSHLLDQPGQAHQGDFDHGLLRTAPDEQLSDERDDRKVGPS